MVVVIMVILVVIAIVVVVVASITLSRDIYRQKTKTLLLEK